MPLVRGQVFLTLGNESHFIQITGQFAAPEERVSSNRKCENLQYRSPPLSTGDTFQDTTQPLSSKCLKLRIVPNPIYNSFLPYIYTYLPMIKFNL